MKNLYVRAAICSISLLLLLPAGSQAQTKKTTTKKSTATSSAPAYRYAYEHGYRAGYEDGFKLGKADFQSQQSRDFRKSDEYNRADRTYNERMGTYLEYQEGYRYGIELGYGDGYFGRTYSVTIPANLGRVVTASINAANATNTAATSQNRSQTQQAQTEDERREDQQRQSDPRGQKGPGYQDTRVPPDIQMKIRLDSRISTKESKEGDQFTARVLDPSGYADAVIVGHVAKLKKSGSATGKTELSLAFDSLTTSNGRQLAMDGEVVKVYASEKVKSVDEEGTVQTDSRTKDTTIRTGGGAAVGAIIGAIAGGGKGAGIGAAIGAGVGAGSVFIEGGKELTLDAGTEILIKTAGPGKK
jgi:type IV secretion system protein VirB10